MKSVMLDILDFSYFADPRFSLFAASNFLLYMWYDVPYVYLADFAIERGFGEDQASILISTIGVVNMVGEVRYYNHLIKRLFDVTLKTKNLK
jgi:hypothetical protein